MPITRYIKNSILYLSRLFYKNKSGVNLIGYYSYTFGVAEVGRFFAQYTRKSGIPISIFDLESPYHKKLDEDTLNFYRPLFSQNPPYYKNIFFVNADLIANLKVLLPKLFIGRYNTAVFFWEFNDYFDFPSAFKIVDEVFAFTDFIATAIRKSAPLEVKVTRLPFPFIRNWEITKPIGAIRKHHNIHKDTFTFIFNFDFNSVYERKNPEAILKAFEHAFNIKDNVCLLLKTIHAEDDSKSNVNFKGAINRMILKEKVILVNDNLERNDFMNLINASDCYISLHRSEGLGLGMLEAMSMGKPVIATNYGGNTDFMSNDNSLLVSYTLIPVEEDTASYKAGWLWADANIEEAADYMVKLYTDNTFTSDLGIRAKKSIQKQFSNNIFEKSLTDWLST